MVQKYNIKRRPRRTRADLERLKDRALQLLGARANPTQAANILRQSPRLVQKWAEQWEAAGLLVAERRSSSKTLSLTRGGSAAVLAARSRVAVTANAPKTGASTRETPKNNSDPVIPPAPGDLEVHAHSQVKRNRDRPFYAGPHYLWFKAPVLVPGRDLDPVRFPLRRLTKGGEEAMRGWKYLGGHKSVPGVGVVLFERSVPVDPERGHGWLHARFDLAALEGETPVDCALRARAAGWRALYHIARRYGMRLSDPVHVGNQRSRSGGHHAVARHPIAKYVTRRFGRREVATRRGEMGADKSHWGGEIEGTHEEDVDDLLLVGQHAAEARAEVVELRGDLHAIWESLERQVKTTAELAAAQRKGTETQEELANAVVALPKVFERIGAVLAEVIERTARSAPGTQEQRKPKDAPPPDPDSPLWG